jgi:hypothetical protein
MWEGLFRVGAGGQRTPLSDRLRLLPDEYERDCSARTEAGEGRRSVTGYAARTPRALRLVSEFFIEASQEQEKLRTLQVNMAHLNGL